MFERCEEVNIADLSAKLQNIVNAERQSDVTLTPAAATISRRRV